LKAQKITKEIFFLHGKTHQREPLTAKQKDSIKKLIKTGDINLILGTLKPLEKRTPSPTMTPEEKAENIDLVTPFYTWNMTQIHKDRMITALANTSKDERKDVVDIVKCLCLHNESKQRQFVRVFSLISSQSPEKIDYLNMTLPSLHLEKLEKLLEDSATDATWI